MIKKTVFVLLILLVLPAYALAESPTVWHHAEVIKLTDGDSWRVRILETGEETAIRLVGIDCPEMNTPEGKTAAAYTWGWLEQANGTIELQELTHRGKYGRVLAYVWANGRMLNEDLLRHGFARVRWLRNSYPHAERLRNAESESAK